MSECRRFEAEALDRWERGEELSGHFLSCPDCLAAAESYRRLREDLLRVDEGEMPPADWQEKVRARIERQQSPPSRLPRNLRALGLLAAAITFVVVGLRFVAPDAPALDLSVERGSGVLRGDSLRPGDTLIVETVRPLFLGPKSLEVRLYRNDRTLVARCPGSVGCQISGRLYRLRVPVPAVGTYQPIVAYGASPLPVPQGELDEDADRILRNDGRVLLGPEVIVH